MSGIDAAAAAFSKDMGGDAPPVSHTNVATEAGDLDVSDVFARRQIEGDTEAGGDDTPADGEVQEEVVPPRKGEEPDPDADPLYDEPETDPKKVDEEDEDEEADPDADPKDGEVVDLDPDLQVTVTVDGEEKVVTVAEALEGYIRTETFYQRLNEVDEIKKVLRTETGTLIEQRKEAIALLSELEEDMTSLLPDEPDWDKLYAEKPTEARGIQKNWEIYQKKIVSVREKRGEQQRKLQQDNNARIVEFATSEKAKFDNMAENRHWKTDPKKKDKDLAAMVRTAKSLGFTNEEIAGTLDARMLTILLRASKYDRMTANKPKLAPKGIKTAKPGAGTGRGVRTAQRGLGRAQQQLARSGRVDDAAAVFQTLIK
jgi:hypothetical protein